MTVLEFNLLRAQARCLRVRLKSVRTGIEKFRVQQKLKSVEASLDRAIR